MAEPSRAHWLESNQQVVLGGVEGKISNEQSVIHAMV
jgi:hypothetical protein